MSSLFTSDSRGVLARPQKATKRPQKATKIDQGQIVTFITQTRSGTVPSKKRNFANFLSTHKFLCVVAEFVKLKFFWSSVY